MRRLPILAVLCLLAISVSGQPNKATTAKQKDTQTQPPTTVINLENCEESKAHPSEANSNPPKWYAPIKRAIAQPDWWLVFIAFLTGCAIAYQAREMASPRTR